MHTSDVDGDKSAQGSDSGRDRNGCIRVVRVRAKKEVLETKIEKGVTPRKAKDGNKFIPKVIQRMRRSS